MLKSNNTFIHSKQHTLQTNTPMVLRTISPFYDTRDMIQTHTYASEQVRLLLINIYRSESIHSGFQVLIAIHIGVECQVFIFFFFVVIVIAHIGVSIDTSKTYLLSRTLLLLFCL